jgi:hypothetical protein
MQKGAQALKVNFVVVESCSLHLRRNSIALPFFDLPTASSRSRQWPKSTTGVLSGIPTGFNHPAQR